MTPAIERFLDEVLADPRSSLDMVDLIEEILTKRYLAGDDDDDDADAHGDRIFKIISREDLTLTERCEALAALVLGASPRSDSAVDRAEMPEHRISPVLPPASEFGRISNGERFACDHRHELSGAQGLRYDSPAPGITPSALTIAPLVTEAKIPTVVMVSGG
jgi:hypothetical protein